jgi:hypothetical protein
MQTVRTTLNLDATLIEAAQAARPGLTRSAIVEEGLKALLAREAALRLAALGGTAPRARGPRRRRSHARR